MPRVPDQWLDAIVYVYASAEAAERGERVGGTGFVVSLPPKDPRITNGVVHHYVVTNRHVVEGRGALGLRVNLRAGGVSVIEVKESEWVFHPRGDDIAAATLAMDFSKHRYAAVNRSMLLTEDSRGRFDIGPGDDVFFIGRYIDFGGESHNVPVVRRGILAAVPAEAVSQRPKRDHDQESILIEATSLSGFSGSPVFVTASPFIERSDDYDGAPVVRMIREAPVFLLGVNWGHSPVIEPVRRMGGEPSSEGTYVSANSGLMFVIPAVRLIELLEESPTLRVARDEWEEREVAWLSEQDS